MPSFTPAPFPTAVNRITCVNARSTGLTTDSGHRAYDFTVRGIIDKFYTGTEHSETFYPSLSSTTMTIQRAAAEISIWTRPGSRLRVARSGLDINVEARLAFEYQLPTFHDETSEEKAKKKRDLEIERQHCELDQQRFKLMLQVCREFISIDATLIDDPERLAFSAMNFVNEHEEKKMLQASVKPAPSAPVYRPGPRM